MDLAINHTLAIIIITVIISLLAFNQPRIMNRLIFWGPAVGKGQFDRLITYGFVHADGFHLLFHMFTLFLFWRVLDHFSR